MNENEFKKWRERMGLSLTKAGKALGCSRRTITNYQNGTTTPIPGGVVKLCELLEQNKILGI